MAVSLSLIGSSITQNAGSVVLHSGSLDLQATGASGSTNGGNIQVNGTLDVSGGAQTVFSLTKYTNGGQVVLDSLHGQCGHRQWRAWYDRLRRLGLGHG